MAIWIASLLFAGVAVAHTGVKSLHIDGTTYAPFDGRLDHMLGTVRRIEWSRDISMITHNPITNFSDPNLACRENGKPPLLKAPARAGSDISFVWTPITRMHHGPILAYLAPLPSPNTPPQQLKFFKIFEKGFDPAADEWANQIASDKGDSYTIQLPSDIKPGTYVLRTELIALHGNMKSLDNPSIIGQVQIYPHCFNLEISGSGTVEPEGVTIPGAYKVGDAGLVFDPYLTNTDDASGSIAHNSKYVAPGPPKYAGKYDAPTGPRAAVKETGHYPAEIETTYQDLLRKIERPSRKLLTYINTAWPKYKQDKGVLAKYGSLAGTALAEGSQVKASLKGEIEAMKKLSQEWTSKQGA